MKYILGQINFTETFRELFMNFFLGLPKIFYALVIILVGFIISKIIEKFVGKVLTKIGVDRLGDKINEIEMVDKANINFKISSLLSKILYYFILLFFFIVATSILDMPPVSELVMNIFNFIPKLLVALIILILGTVLADALKGIILTACNSLNIPSGKLIANFVFYFLFINIFISALTQTGIKTDFLSNNISIIIGGVVLAFAIGYGLATKNTMANYLASFYSKKQCKIGDKVTFDDVTGTIVEMDNSSMVLKTETSKIIIPLNKMTEEKIEIHL